MARLILAARARTEVLQLDWPLIDAIEEALALLEREPASGHELRGRLAGLRSMRGGAYRIVYQLDDERTVRVLAVRHRSAAYARDPR